MNITKRAQNLIEKAKCCACGGPLVQDDTDTFKIVMLNYRAAWKNPTWAIPSDDTRKAVAAICEACFRENNPAVEAIEIETNNHEIELKYHEVGNLEPAPFLKCGE